jgi:SAM-dependent methyltransferase
MKASQHEDEELASEIQPFRHWLSGSVLNAGCGRRWLDLGPTSFRVDIDREFAVDIDVISDVHNLPFNSKCFDSILSIAVLEHTKYAWVVAQEFYRVLKVGGVAVVCIPFMQPIHGAPQDYVRFTGEGIRMLMEWAGFHVIQVRGVHSLGFTIEWILREILNEHRYWRYMLWPLRRTVFPLLRKGYIFPKPVLNMQSAFYIVADKR